MEEKKRDYGLKSAENTLRILDYFGTCGIEELSIADVKNATGLSKTTVFRNLKVLCKFGYLERDDYTMKYKLGTKIVEFATYKVDMLDIMSESLPILMMVHAGTSANISLCELQGTNVVRLLMIRGNLIIKKNSHSTKLPAYCSSPGKCLLSSLSKAELNKLFDGYEFIRYTDTTITNLEDLKDELKKIRKQGYAMNMGEQEPYTRSIAVPIYGYSGNMIAAISAGTPLENFTEKKQEQLLMELSQASRIISHKMGYDDSGIDL